MIDRILLIAKRDYISSVMSKAYLVGVMVLPAMFGAMFLFTALANKSGGKREVVAVIDHTGISAAAIVQAARARNPLYAFEEVRPEANEAGQLLLLSDKIRRGELFLVLDISARGPVRYYTSSTSAQLNGWLTETVNDGLHRARLAQLGITPPRIADLMRGVPVLSMNLVIRNAQTGQIEEGKTFNRLQAFVVPFFLVILLLLTVMAGASQKLGAIAEDKMQRVFEMLLVSASPFELMMGKVLAALGISLTGCLIHISVGIMALYQFATLDLLPLHLLPWFFAYLVADVVMLSAMGAALGSACNTPQDAQSLQFFLFLPILIPVLMIAPIMQQPNGQLATVMSFFPPFTPLIMMLRQALPGGVPWWQPWVGVAGTATGAFFVTWAAARIFRIGILSQGKTPDARELMQWMVRG